MMAEDPRLKKKKKQDSLLRMSVCFFMCSWLSNVAFTISLGVLSSILCGLCEVLMLQYGVQSEPLRWQPNSGLWKPENSWLHGILIGESSPKGLRVNTKTKPHPKASKLQCWMSHTKILSKIGKLLISREVAQSHTKSRDNPEYTTGHGTTLQRDKIHFHPPQHKHKFL